MSSWAGFSDEDLRKLRQQEPAKKGAGTKKSSEEAAAKARPQRAVRPMKATDTPALTPSPSSDSQAPEIQGASSSHLPIQNIADKRPAGALQPNTAAGESETSHSANAPEHVSGTEDISKPGTVATILSESDGLSREMGNLESFRAKQQMMEELNKKKKHMLESAIAERQKRTTAESRKLQHIQKELAQIDQQLTVDVSILRNRIEESAREFAEAQRRYDQAEKEFVAAKIEVHKKAHMKEQLTEHLYTIIHQNELRKAKRLAELMAKLELEDVEGAAAASDAAVAAAAAAVPPILLLDTATSGVGLLKPVAPSTSPLHLPVTMSATTHAEPQAGVQQIPQSQPQSAEQQSQQGGPTAIGQPDPCRASIAAIAADPATSSLAAV